MLVDRLAVLLTICNSRHGGDWNPFALDKTYDAEGSLGDELRGWDDYKTARKIVNRWLENVEKNRE